jgi:hypothetical protein
MQRALAFGRAWHAMPGKNARRHCAIKLDQPLGEFASGLLQWRGGNKRQPTRFPMETADFNVVEQN